MRKCLLVKVLLLCMLILYQSPCRAYERMVVADFSAGVDKSGVPAGWKFQERIGKATFSVVKEGDFHALHLQSEDASFSFQKAVNLNTLHYPLLSWKWKVTKLPKGGDIRNPKADDQAAQLFLAFSNRKVIVYIWDTSAPEGLMYDAWGPPFFKVKAVVVRSGHDQTGKWITETRNAHLDYMKIFGHEPPRLAGVRIQINTQHTETTGESFFADVVFKKK